MIIRYQKDERHLVKDFKQGLIPPLNPLAKMKHTLPLLSLVFLFHFSLLAQEIATVKPFVLVNGNAKIHGTSSIQEWDCASHLLEGDARFLMAGDELISLRDLRIKIPVNSIQSGHTAMDTHAHKALRSESHPDITFLLKQVLSMQLTDGQYQIMARGRLNIAGASREIEMLVQGLRQGSDRIVFSGSHDINMIDYGVKPPTIAYGIIRTDEVVTIEFHAAFERAGAPQAMN